LRAGHGTTTRILVEKHCSIAISVIDPGNPELNSFPISMIDVDAGAHRDFFPTTETEEHREP